MLFRSCNHNRLTHLPALNQNLNELNCINNKIIVLPLLNESLNSILFSNNPAYTIIYGNAITFHHHRNYFYDMMNMDEYQEFMFENSTSIHHLAKKVKTLHKFRFLFYSLKFKTGFRTFLWEKIRRPKIEAKYHPDNLHKLLKNISDEDDVSEIWTADD